MQDRFQILKRLLAVNNKYFFCCLTLLFYFVAFAQTTEVILTPTSTSPWTVPSDVTKITVEAWGGGGKGGSRTTGNNIGFGGGGGGAYARSIFSNFSSNSFNFSVGTGSSVNNDPGGNSWFESSTSLLAVGGQSVTVDSENGVSGGNADNCEGSFSYSGGDGANGSGSGNNALGGGGGSSAGNTTDGNNGVTGNGGTAPTMGGAGGDGATRGNNGSNGEIPGGGGGGAASHNRNVDGGNGANGQIIITYSTFSLNSISVSPTSICANDNVTVTINSNLPDGDYTFTYTLTGNDAGDYTTSITASSGSATFDTNNLTGTTTITITNIENDSYGNDITANNTANVTVIPTISIAGADEICVGETTQLTTSSGGNWVSNNPSVATVQSWDGLVTGVSAGTATFTITTYYPVCTATTPEITVLSTPSEVNVSGGGSYCGSTTLTATGGTGGTIYFQGTTSGGTSTANPNTSETITTSGTYYFRAQSANGCWGPEGSAEVIITEIPEISVDNNPSVCQNTTSANLDYTPTNGNPQGFNIYFDSDALSQGFYNQNGSLPGAGNPIVVQVPWSAPVGTYNATITVKTWSPVCTSPSYSFTITVNETVDNPGSITGSTSLCPGVSTATYSIDPVSGATSYTWTVPAGWSITAGQGSTEITVSTGTTGGTISVVAVNDCGTSDDPSTLSVSTQDNEAPAITCPANQTFDANNTGCTYQVIDNSLDASATDNCVLASITHNYSVGGNSLNGESFPVGTTTVTWTASDGGGLDSTCTLDITVVNPVSATISTLYVEDCPDLDSLQGFNPQSGSYNAGSTDITFEVTLSGTSATTWRFDYEIKDATVRTDLTDPPFTPFYNQSGNIIDTNDNPVSLTFYINNNPPVELHPSLEITNITDGNGCNAADATPLSVTIKAMPDVGDYE